MAERRRRRIVTEIFSLSAEIAQLGERQTEDLKVPGSIPGLGSILKLEHIWLPAFRSEDVYLMTNQCTPVHIYVSTAEWRSG